MKYFAFSLILIVVSAGFMACTKADATKTSNNQSNQTNQSNIPKGDYPPAPTALMEAKLTRTDGSTFTLSDYKGKVIVVNAWATWCGPCRYEIPELVRLQTELKDKGLAVVGLNVDADEDAEMIKEFGKELNINYDLVKADYKLFGEFIKISKKDAIPQTFLIDREGRLLGVFVGAGKSLQRLIESIEKTV
jgi:thiol-disulfide isomerase/thioredoxin